VAQGLALVGAPVADHDRRARDLSGMLETTTAERLATGVQQQLGHASIGQTADTYGHVQPERHESAVEALIATTSRRST
ncbi:MAG: hypothetical protein DMD75_14930, partial [Candidatus Rokuibacteriota bacterium]